MTSSLWLSLLGFSFVSSITPGPNNVMLLASGLNFGFPRSVPHMFGIAFGFVILLLVIGLGLGGLFVAFPALHRALAVLGAAYLVYLAWKVATGGEIAVGETRARPMTAYEAALFQWVNPKAWVMAITGMAFYVDPAHPIASVIGVAVAFGIVNLPCISVWAGLGASLRTFLADPRRRRIFNVAMGLLLLASVVPMVLE